MIQGDPDPSYINTSYVERQDLTMRMSMRRFTRLTNAFSKKFENHCHALAFCFFWYNWVRTHKAVRMTPAMAAGIASSPIVMAQLCEVIDAQETAALQAKRERMLNPPLALPQSK